MTTTSFRVYIDFVFSGNAPFFLFVLFGDSIAALLRRSLPLLG